MIKVETLGMIEVSKNNPVLTSETDVKLYDFITVDGVVYLVANTLTGDDAYQDGVTIKAGEYLNGFDLRAWEGQRLVIDMKHIDGDSVEVGATLVVDGSKLKADTASSGVYFKVTDKCRLTGEAVKAVVMVA